MRKVLIDLNIILDMLTKRKDHEAAAAVFDKCVKRKIKGYICSHEITTLSYFLEREKYEINKRNKIIAVQNNHINSNCRELSGAAA